MMKWICVLNQELNQHIQCCTLIGHAVGEEARKEKVDAEKAQI